MARTTDILKRMKDDDIQWVDLQFVDGHGALQHITVHAREIDADSFTEGVGKLDGSSIRGFKMIYESDMRLVPDADTYNLIPWEERTARFICDIKEGGAGETFDRDARFVAQKAEDAIKSAGYTSAHIGPELEFFIFDSVTADMSLPARGMGFAIDSREAAWNSYGQNYPINYKQGYYPAPPQDTLQPLRAQICNVLENNFAIQVEAHHHEVATAGQCEINIRHDTLKTMADKVVTYKYVVKNICSANGVIATFMPKPIFGDNGSGMHTHISIWKNDKNVFFDASDKYAEISQVCRYFMGGLVEHGPALGAFTNPTTNSYKRLVPGYEAPAYLVWSKSNRSAAIRIPRYFSASEKATRIEYRSPDPSCNPYLSFSALIAAGLDGIKKKSDPGKPVDEDIFELSRQKRKELGIKELCGSLEESIEALASDNNFLKGMFGSGLLDSYMELKLEEHKQESTRPSPWEFYTYLNC
ncbi:Glutamine synthetase [Candidatus Gugararchaeum adminiculabundum]|nr:Glutamine synthetase [Candidatus Gugararchaeum adminiculabundum]